MSKLPSYLRFKTNGSPLENSCVVEGDVRITVIAPRLIRIEQGEWTDKASMTVLHRDFCPCDFVVSRDENVLKIETESLLIQYVHHQTLKEGLTISGKSEPGFLWHFGQKPLHNLGGTVSTLDCVDGACALDDGICAIDGFSFFDDAGTPLFDEDGWLIAREKTTDLYFFGYGHDYTACVQDYYRLTGKPEMLPAFVFGNWWSRYHAYSDREYLALMDKFIENDVPLSVGIVDMDWHLTKGDNWKPWHNGWTGYTWNKELFPDYRQFIRELHRRGLHTALNLHPASGVQSYEDQYSVMAERMGIDPATEKTVPCDYLNPKYLQAYFEELHFPYEKDGIDFWWMDWQQGCDYSVVMGEDYKPNGLECVKPLWILNHMHYLASQREGKRGLIFSRFGGFGSQRYPIGFSGDTTISWASLDFQPYFTVTASNIGYGWWSHDIGGHMLGIRDDEMTVRWIQFGVFSPIFRLHSTDSIFLGREPWNYNPRARAVIERFMRLRHQLFPYLYTMCHRDCTQLLPLMRPMYHAYPESPEAYRVKNQYFFGSELIAAPITQKADGSDQASAMVWLPKGTWTDFFNGFVYHGDQMLDVYRPMESMPLFMKAGAIIPMQVHEKGSRSLGCARNMEVYIAPGDCGCFTLYEDDGLTLNYRDGVCCTTRMNLDWAQEKAMFRISPAVGETDLIPESRSWTIKFRGFRAGAKLFVNGNACEAAYDAQTHTYSVVVSNVPVTVDVSVEIHNANGLIHNNGDIRDHVIDFLTRAQCSLYYKDKLLAAFDDAVKSKRNGLLLERFRLGSDSDPSLGGKLWEMIHQI